MKKITQVLLLILVPFYSFSQITISSSATKKNKIEAEPYDSLSNFLGDDYKQYIGQKLYLLPKAESLKEYGYTDFFKDYKKSHFKDSNKFKCCDGFDSKYKPLQGKYFTVLDVIEDGSRYVFLHLEMDATGEKVYYKYNSNIEFLFPFLVLGFFEKQKEIFVGKQIILRPHYNAEFFDIDTGEKIKIAAQEYLTCTNITIEDEKYDEVLVLENKAKQKFFYRLDYRFLNTRRVFTKSEVDNYINRFGVDNWSVIYDEEVKIGFTKEMVKLALGQPEKINRSSYNEQWVYDNQYLYFEKGKLTAFN